MNQIILNMENMYYTMKAIPVIVPLAYQAILNSAGENQSSKCSVDKSGERNFEKG